MPVSDLMGYKSSRLKGCFYVGSQDMECQGRFKLACNLGLSLKVKGSSQNSSEPSSFTIRVHTYLSPLQASCVGTPRDVNFWLQDCQFLQEVQNVMVLSCFSVLLVSL